MTDLKMKLSYDVTFTDEEMHIITWALLNWAIHRPRQEHLTEERDLHERQVALAIHGRFAEDRTKQVTDLYDRITNEFGTNPDAVVPPVVHHVISLKQPGDNGDG